jgi:hypothetical protein
MKLILNGFDVQLSSPTFSAWVQDVPDPKGMKLLRETHKGEWFFHWRGGKAYAIPRVVKPSKVIGQEQQLACADYEHLIL